MKKTLVKILATIAILSVVIGMATVPTEESADPGTGTRPLSIDNPKEV